MNKKLIFILSTSVVCLASCSEIETKRGGISNGSIGLNTSSTVGESDIVGTRWANTITSPTGSCSDSLHSLNSSEVVLFDCELGWHFDAHEELKPSSIWKLMKNEDHLAVSSIMLLRSDEWEEVPAENYNRIGDFKQVNIQEVR